MTMSALRILVVDDEPAIRRALGRLLRRRGHEVWLADGALDARVKLADARPHVVVADLHLRDGSGEELLAEVQARFSLGPRVALVLSTGDDVPEGRYPVLRKPYSPDALDAMLRRLTPAA